jgi:hypothetical protein
VKVKVKLFVGLITHYASKTFVRQWVAARFCEQGTPLLPPAQEAGLAPETVWKLDTVKKRKIHGIALGGKLTSINTF